MIMKIKNIRMALLFVICMIFIAFGIIVSGNDTYAKDDDNTQEEMSEAVKLIVDTNNCYEGMEKSYSEGYEPIVSGNNVSIYLPLVTKTGKIRDNELRAKVNMGDFSSPFVNKNYNKTFRKKKLMTTKEKETEVYLLTFNLALKADRMNGTYPVTLEISGSDEAGMDIEFQYTIYVNISDGRDIEESTEEVTTEEINFAPKVIVEGCKTLGEAVFAGEETEITVSIRNTSTNSNLKNMTVTATPPSTDFVLKSDSDTLFIDEMNAGETKEIKFSYKLNPGTPQGQYNIGIAMDYADTKGNSFSSSGNAKIEVVQPVSIQIDDLIIPESAELGENIEASFMAMNTGRSKLYNVYAEIECKGLNPNGTLFIGDIEPGAALNSSTRVRVGSVSADNAYGSAEGTVTYYYEDEAGNKYNEKRQMYFTVNTPFSDTSTTVEVEDNTKQWWKGVLILCIVMGLIFSGNIYIKHKRVSKG